jgi:DNA-binding NtrC family response regulator
MMTYDWPGNIREMENVMEQAFVLNDGESPLQWGRPLVNIRPAVSSPAAADPSSQSLPGIRAQQQAVEKDYLLSILKKTNGRVRGMGGAAEILNMKPTTLESRMAKLGIKKEHG